MNAVSSTVAAARHKNALARIDQVRVRDPVAIGAVDQHVMAASVIVPGRNPPEAVTARNNIVSRRAHQAACGPAFMGPAVVT